MKILGHQIVIIQLMIIFHLPIMAANENCNYYPNSPFICASNISIFKCQYNIEQKKCLETNQQNLGCSQYLNQEACINQLKNFQGENIFCAFLKICQTIDLAEVQKLGCSDKVNKLACMNVKNQKCFWKNKCQQENQNTEKTTQKCNQYNTPVTPYTCQQIQSALCMNTGYDGDFRCAEVRLDQLSKLTCNELGLNEKACIAITTENQFCVFQDDQCKSIHTDQITSCQQKLNKNACISLIQHNEPQLLCEWIDSSCRIFQEKKLRCQTENLVNAAVCTQSQSFCMYDEKQQKCLNVEVNDLDSLGCNTPGLSKKACLKIKSQSCSFFKNRCQELNAEDLSFYKCNGDLNEKACVNLKTNSEFCLWNGNNCQAISINQDTKCPLEMKNSMKVNGNVCQAISKPNVMCKYDINSNLCIKSSINDQCSTPFLNQFGCVSIQKIQQTCQWTNKGCVLIMIQQNLTTCESLGYANPISCSQVYENDSIGCYYDSTKQQCKSIQMNADNNFVKQLLNTLDCNNLTLGLNRVICGSIITQSTPCRWFQEQCVYFSKRSDIADVPCLYLQYSNYQACALASFNNEPCMYSKKLLGCINTFSENNKNCETLGLNSIGCDQINRNSNSNICYFDQKKCIRSILNEQDVENENDNYQGNIENYYNTVQKCTSKFVTKSDCASIITNGQLCQWSFQNNACTEISVEYNTKCIKYTGKDVIINPNVCASIQADQPDYCTFDKETTNCKIFFEGCTTQCCTEIESIGINAHSCSKFTSSNADVYCYFIDYKCTELSTDILDTSDEDLVKAYFNHLQLTCTSMNYNSCHMIDWSKSQRCYFDGQACINLNISLIKDLTILTQKFIPPNKLVRLNKSACLSIEAKITEVNKEKYFGYDDENKICKNLKINEDFQECKQAIGNKNVCTRFTGKLKCIWNVDELECVDIKKEELGELINCNSNLNSLACIENVSASQSRFNNALPCFFSYDTDMCQEAPQQVECEYFKGRGEISNSVCERINQEGQKCKYSEANKTCVISEEKFENCNISGYANNRVCYSSTKGNCRWDPFVFKCYENQTEIEELNCTDNLNKILCVQVKKQACMWDDVKFQCQRFVSKTSDQFENSNQNANHLYNERACLFITGAGYYYNEGTKQCIKIKETINTLKCNGNEFKRMNQYACLYQTRTHLCYYDQQEQLCKDFEDEQSECNTTNQINIEVCMNIPVACIFKESTLQCYSFTVDQTMTCTALFNYSQNKEHHNKISCASVSENLTQVFSEKQCSEEKDNFEKCLYEKYCYWAEYSCQVYRLLINYFDTGSQKTQQSITCPNHINVEKGCQQDLSIYDLAQFIPKRLSIIQSQIIWQNETCIRTIQQYTREYIYNSKENQSLDCEIKICTQSEQIICSKNIEGFNIIDLIKNDSEYQNDEFKQFHHILRLDDDTNPKVCQKQFNFPYEFIQPSQCNKQEYYVATPWCQLRYNEIRICDKSFSKALCLELNQESCYFDINQGGCLQLQYNEHKIPNCASLSNNCYQSYSKNAICKNGVVLKQPGDSCFNVKRDQQICESSSFQIQSFLCNEISGPLTQPVLCASASDYCRFDGINCVNTFTKPCKCDKSFSKTLCEVCDCDYISLGYCSKKDDLYPNLNQDCSNKYYQCYEVTQLFTSVASKKRICGLVDQACKFTDKCVDATHSTCQELSKLVVSKQACVRCTGLAMKYDNVSQLCEHIAQDISQCENLNKLACLSFSKTEQCQWQKSLSTKCLKYEFGCKRIPNILKTDQFDCQSLNQVACNQEQQNICWFNPLSKLCEQFNLFSGTCESYMNKQICNLSMVESCIWQNDKCNKNPLQSNQSCVGLNKFGCLNLQSQPCVWHSQKQECQQAQFLGEQISCTEFLQNQSEISHMNAQTCSQINVKKNCMLNKNFKCKEILEPQFYECEQSGFNTLGLNRNACLFKTKNSCAFKNNNCISSQNLSEGCKDYLNKQGCLNQDVNCQYNCFVQDGKCKFSETQCSELSVSSNFSELENYAPYSKSICTAFNKDVGLMYSSIQNKCLEVESQTTKPKDCNYPGLNRYACLNQIQNYCQYYEGKCQYINPESIKECLNTLNSYACIQAENIKCKFLKIQKQCIPIKADENCQTIANNQDIVSKKICQSYESQLCSYNNIDKSCRIITEKQQESCKDLSLLPCIFNTQNLFCEFDENKKMCQNSFGYSECTDKINQNKCLAIITKGQFCKFIEEKGCQPIDVSEQLQKCQKDFQTNPITCSQSTDIPCFYDKDTKQCIKYSKYKNLDNLNLPGDNDKSYLNYALSNIYSLNKQACQEFKHMIYKQDSRKETKQIFLQWMEGACIQIKGIQQLGRLNCNQNLNENLCVNIRKPFQYCHFLNNECKQSDLKSYQDKNCESIKLINSGAFCSQTQDVPCYYDSQNFECKQVPDDFQIECAEKDPEQKGYNKLACDLNINCFFNEQCFKRTTTDKQYIKFCQDVEDLYDCSRVMLEGCMILNNQCVSIINSDYNKIKCEQAKNQKGCTDIQTEGQFCQYDQGECRQQNLIEMRKKNCLDIKFVNNQAFCQYPQDTGCIYDFTQKSCQQVEISEQDKLTCSKGINRIACLKLTNSNLKCSFLDYCFGPNYNDKNCDKDNKSCINANSIETCLNQIYCKCQWQSDKCQSYPANSQQSQCDDIKNSSVAVCNSIQDCILDSQEFKCKSTNTSYCDQLQSPSQCSKMPNLPCIWKEEAKYCTYLENSDQLNCQDIALLNGSQRACMNIKKQGQMCIFKNNKCIAFEQNKDQDNCLDSININSCLQQKINDCYWNKKLYKVKKTYEDAESDVEYGSCMKFDENEIDKFLACDIRLSYTSCLNTKKEGVFCKWNNQQCSIIDDNGFINHQPSDFTEVNQNACGLVNNGDIVKYDFITKSCSKVDNIRSLSCLTEGLNKDACLSVQFESCLWDSTRRKCRHQKLLRNLNRDTCRIQNWSSSLCSQINSDNACGFLKNGCDYVDLNNVKCTYEGLNKYACLNIKQYTCIWLKNQNGENYHCEDYLSYLPCDQIPPNVNPKVCSMVKEGSCYYNQENFKCEIPNKANNNCELLGLNIVGCVQIENCFFDQTCQLLNKTDYNCKEFPIANKLICKNARDSCKYNELAQGCSPAQDESCSNDSLSDQGCLSQQDCVLKDQKCQCRRFIENYDCTLIKEMDKCIKQSHCTFSEQKNFRNQQCMPKRCKDLTPDECDGKQILRSICYWSKTNECLSAEKCEDINQNYYQCSKYYFNDRPCQKNNNSDKCDQFKCENFSEETCLQYWQFCNFNDQKCQQKQCYEYQMGECSVNKCEWNLKENTCQEQHDCSTINSESQCNKYKYHSKPCQWNSDTQSCIEQRCSNIKQIDKCIGSLAGIQNCFLIDDSYCISCEEISDSCDCLQYSEYCSYDIIKDLCSTKKCESYQLQEECPQNYCKFINQKCQLKCEYQQIEEQCQQTNHCKWIDQQNLCQLKCEYAFDEEQCTQMNTCQWVDSNCFKDCQYIQVQEQCKQITKCQWIDSNNKCLRDCQQFQVQEQCQLMIECKWIDSNKKCQRDCEQFEGQEQCQQTIECKWIDSNKKCQRDCEQFEGQEQCQQTIECKWIDSNKKCQIDCLYLEEKVDCKQRIDCFWQNQKCEQSKQASIVQIIGFMLLCLILT